MSKSKKAKPQIDISARTREDALKVIAEGKRLKKEWPGVPVIKTWYTCNDDLVCPICKSLDGKEVELDKNFTKGIFMPPACPECRCWISVSTALADADKPWYKRLFGKK